MQKPAMATSKSHNHKQKLHFVMFPLMAPGHMIPIIDMAKLLAKHGVIITIVTTPVNATRFKPTIDRATQNGLELRVAQLEFPCKDAGLPEGCENIDMLPSLNMGKEFILAASKLQEPAEKLLQELQPSPSCIISDMVISWTIELARIFDIPRIVFHGTNLFYLLCSHNLITYDNVLENISSENEPFLVPGLPDRVEVTKAQLPTAVKPCETGFMLEMRRKMREAERESFGVVVNSFKELEFEYFERYKKAKGKSVWCVGPVSLCSKDKLEIGERGNMAAIDGDRCLEWLDSHKPRSVIYACLGSLCNLVASEVLELGLGLEASEKPFILVLRGWPDLEEAERLIEEDGFEERVKGRGLVIRGWAPQVLILSHPAVGGFLTHCGWNSTLEGLTAGLPMVTCPLFAEQFLNEKLLVQVLRVGVSIRSENAGVRMEVKGETESLAVKREDVKRGVKLVMGEEREESKEMRERAWRVRGMAMRAVEEGGSSDNDMRLMIQEILQLRDQKKADNETIEEAR